MSDEKDAELFCLMENLGVSSPDRIPMHQRPACHSRKKSPPHSSFAPILKEEDHDVADVIIPSPLPMGLEYLGFLFDAAVLPGREDHLIQISSSEKRRAPSDLENTSPMKRNAKTAGDDDDFEKRRVSRDFSHQKKYPLQNAFKKRRK